MALPSTGPEEGNHARSVVTPTRLSIIAIVAVVVVALVVVLLPRTNTGPPPSSGASPTAEAPTPTVEPTATPESTPEPVAAWTGLTWSDPVTPTFVVHVHDLVPWGDGYVAVGEVEVDATRSEAAFMTSPDGLNWTVTEQQDPGFDRYPRHLASLGDELLAFSHRATTEGLAIGGPTRLNLLRRADLELDRWRLDLVARRQPELGAGLDRCARWLHAGWLVQYAGPNHLRAGRRCRWA